MSALETLLATAAGSGLIGLTLIDVFATLFSHPTRGPVGHRLTAATWAAFRRASPRLGVLGLAGPLSFVAVVICWAAMLAAGWALVYWPHMPDAFVLGPGVAAGDDSSLLDSVYLSLVTLATLGYGDIAPGETWLRIVAPLESLLGLGLLTASVSWLLSIFPMLSRRRALAYEISLLKQAGSDAAALPGPPLPSSVYADLTSRLVGVERDLVTFPVTYYFHEDDPRFALPAAIHKLLELAEDGRQPQAADDTRFHAELLRRTIDDFASSIAERFRLPAGDVTGEILAAYASDHAVGSATPAPRADR